MTKTLPIKEGIGGQKWFLGGTFGNRDDAEDQAAEYAEEGFFTNILKSKNEMDWDVWIRPKGAQTARQGEILAGLVGIVGLTAIGVGIAGTL